MSIDLSKIPNMEKRAEAERLWLAWTEAIAAYDNAPADSDEEKKAAEVMEAADEAYNDFDAPDLLRKEADNDELRRCALTGLPIFEDEPYLADNIDPDQVVLKVALGLPLDEEGNFAKPEEQQPEQAAAA